MSVKKILINGGDSRFCFYLKRELSDKISDVLVPVHEVTEVRRGKRVQRKKKYFQTR